MMTKNKRIHDRTMPLILFVILIVSGCDQSKSGISESNHDPAKIMEDFKKKFVRFYETNDQEGLLGLVKSDGVPDNLLSCQKSLLFPYFSAKVVKAGFEEHLPPSEPVVLFGKSVVLNIDPDFDFVFSGRPIDSEGDFSIRIPVAIDAGEMVVCGFIFEEE